LFIHNEVSGASWPQDELIEGGTYPLDSESISAKDVLRLERFFSGTEHLIGGQHLK
jgi:hypothetical protein